MFVLKCDRLVVRSKGIPAVSASFELARGSSLGIVGGDDARMLVECVAGLRPYFGTVECRGSVGFLSRALPPPFITECEYAALHGVVRRQGKKIFSMTHSEKRLMQLEIALNGSTVAALDYPFEGLDDHSKARAKAMLDEYTSLGGAVLATFKEVCEYGRPARLDHGVIMLANEEDCAIQAALAARANLEVVTRKKGDPFEHEEDD